MFWTWSMRSQKSATSVCLIALLVS
jgi:hypothetical protein